jgi:hypothetical protein
MPRRVCLLLAAAGLLCGCGDDSANQEPWPPEPFPEPVSCRSSCVLEGRCTDMGYCSCEKAWKEIGPDEYILSLTRCYIDNDLVYEHDPLQGEGPTLVLPWECCQATSVEDCASTADCALHGECTPCLGYCVESCE